MCYIISLIFPAGTNVSVIGFQKKILLIWRLFHENEYWFHLGVGIKKQFSIKTYGWQQTQDARVHAPEAESCDFDANADILEISKNWKGMEFEKDLDS